MAKLLLQQRFVVLDVSDNMISGVGGIVLCHAISRNRTLHNFNAKGNALGKPVAIQKAYASLLGWQEEKLANVVQGGRAPVSILRVHFHWGRGGSGIRTAQKEPT